MASIRQMQSRIKLFGDFQKVISIQKTLVMKEIIVWRKKIKQATFRQHIFQNHLLDINNKYHVLDASYFDLAKNRVPIARNLYFILPSPAGDKISDYADRVLIEYLKKSHQPEDLYVAVGESISKLLTINDLKVVKTLKANVDDLDIYHRIAFQVTRGHSDLLFIKASFVYLSTVEQRVVEEQLFPLANTKHIFDEAELVDFSEDMKIVANSQMAKATFYKDVERVTQNILSQVINMQIYVAVINYRLAVLLRELQTLDEKEKNILEEVAKIELRIQHVRKDSITNELLTNVVAFKVVNARNHEEEYRRKKRAEEEV